MIFFWEFKDLSKASSYPQSVFGSQRAFEKTKAVSGAGFGVILLMGDYHCIELMITSSGYFKIFLSSLLNVNRC